MSREEHIPVVVAGVTADDPSGRDATVLAARLARMYSARVHIVLAADPASGTDPAVQLSRLRDHVPWDIGVTAETSCEPLDVLVSQASEALDAVCCAVGMHDLRATGWTGTPDAPQLAVAPPSYRYSTGGSDVIVVLADGEERDPAVEVGLRIAEHDRRAVRVVVPDDLCEPTTLTALDHAVDRAEDRLALTAHLLHGALAPALHRTAADAAMIVASAGPGDTAAQPLVRRTPITELLTWTAVPVLLVPASVKAPTHAGLRLLAVQP